MSITPPQKKRKLIVIEFLNLQWPSFFPSFIPKSQKPGIYRQILYKNMDIVNGLK